MNAVNFIPILLLWLKHYIHDVMTLIDVIVNTFYMYMITIKLKILYATEKKMKCINLAKSNFIHTSL